jgi:RNA polymerase sigma factor (sigma-70 family)
MFRGERLSALRDRARACESAKMPPERVDDTSLTLMMRLRQVPSDSLAWDEFVERYRPMIRSWCLKWQLQEADADDVVQDVLVKLLGAIKRFEYDPARSFRAWLKTVTSNALSDLVAVRRKSPNFIAASIDQIAESDDARSDLEKRLEEAYDAEMLELAMKLVKKRVKPATFEAFQLTVIEGSSGADTAEKLQVPVAHVFVNKHRVQKMIQSEIRRLRQMRK